MLKTFNKVSVCCPIVFKEEMNALFQKKQTQNDPKYPKTSKILDFYRLHSFFIELEIEFV